MTAALIQDLSQGLMQDFSGEEFPCGIYGFDGDPLRVEGDGTAFGFVWGGSVKVSGSLCQLVGAMRYFAMPFSGALDISAGGKGFIAVRYGYRGMPLFGGPVENVGRLRYIDGCSDSLLIAPPIMGDPCFNLLHFPSGIDQTKHTHPSVRAGLIHHGEGYCHTEHGTEDLRAGRMFILYPDAIHAFSTVGTGGMTLTVFHPETDFGPTHENHPMLNKTIVDGVSANRIDSIRTKDIRE